MSNSKLFENFNPTSAKAWKQKIQFELQGEDFNDRLVWNSIEGIDVKPFYHSETYLKAPRIHHNASNWKIGYSIYVNSEEKSNLHAVKWIKKGAESLHFTLPTDKISIDELLKNIDTSTVSTYFEPLFLSEKLIKNLQAYSQKNNSLFFVLQDPVGHLARSGNWHENLKTDVQKLKQSLSLGANLKSVISVDLGLFQNAGGSMVQQLAYTLAHSNEYLNLFRGEAIKSVVFKVSVGSNYFFEIAKLQALRLLWQSLTKDYGLSIECHILTQPSYRNKTIYDYNINMLRSTTECMSAILGSSDTIINMPYDQLFHKSNAFGSRLSINQLLILKNESYFNTVSNPTEGVYYIESLTQQLAQKSLDLFKEIEAQGGFLKLLKAGNVQRKLKEHAQKESDLFDQGQEGLLGTHFQINVSDKMKSDLEIYPFIKHSARKTLLEPIIPRRISEEIEQNRLKDE
ncbi:MAG: methylmalonyl-CoA mutase subunit beta [Flavobacteriaceae bacterium]|jgi:methylmalonyl-CoA mutase|nr:methylmalonyl-CoA mutase subunit beta [Flavobacteriaceae bacterium]